MVSQNNSSYNNVYKFNGKELDEETGLYYYGARYYDPRISIWLSVDPLATHSKQVGTSPYAYVANNPVNLVDPTGMIWEDPKEAEKLNASINNRIKNVKSNTEKLQKEINTKKGKFLFFSYNLNEKQIAKREDKVAENGQKTELLNRSLADIEDIKNAPDTYRLTSPSGNNGLHGVFKGSDGVINIEGSNSGLHIHEMRHVGQSIEAGGVKFNESGWLLNPSTTYDGATENEVNAYQVQYSYDGSYPGQARSLKDINSTSLFDIKLDNGESVYKNLKKPKKK